jgi:hypothetical protein
MKIFLVRSIVTSGFFGLVILFGLIIYGYGWFLLEKTQIVGIDGNSSNNGLDYFGIGMMAFFITVPLGVISYIMFRDFMISMWNKCPAGGVPWYVPFKSGHRIVAISRSEQQCLNCKEVKFVGYD